MPILSIPNARACAAALLTALLGVTSLDASQAAGGAISVEVNLARILRLSSPASTVIIGNPGIAEVTIQDPSTLVLTGKSFGQTNLIVLDARGNPVADTLVEVVQQEADLVTVYMGSSRTSLACSPVCQPLIMLGDEPDFTANSISSSSLVEGAAQ